MIIFGTRVRHKKLDEGEFVCPKCSAPRHYERKQARRFFTLYFIPLIPLKTLGDFVECQTCGTAYEPRILTIRPPDPATQQSATPNAAQLMNSVKSRLQKGSPVEYVVRDLTAAGFSLDVARSAVASAIGTRLRKCPTCNLSYAPMANNCSECGGVLVD